MVDVRHGPEEHDAALQSAAIEGTRALVEQRVQHIDLGQRVILGPEIDTVIFDFDGTVMNTRYLDRMSFFGALEYRLNLSLDNCRHVAFSTEDRLQLDSSFGRSEIISARGLIENLARHFPDYYALIKDAYERAPTDFLNEISSKRCELAVTYVERTSPDVIGGILPLLESCLASGKTIALCTGSSRTFVIALLQQHKLDRFFPPTHRIFAEDYDPDLSKPEPDPYLLILNKIGRFNQRDRVMVLEDTVGGVEAATKAGLNVLMLARDESEMARLEARNRARRVLPLDNDSTVTVVPSWYNVVVLGELPPIPNPEPCQ